MIFVACLLSPKCIVLFKGLILLAWNHHLFKGLLNLPIRHLHLPLGL